MSVNADPYVAKYVNGSIVEMQDKNVFGIATDKAMINKLPLMNTVIGASNTVALACPNVGDLFLLCIYLYIRKGFAVRNIYKTIFSVSVCVNR